MAAMIADSTALFRYQGKPIADSVRLSASPAAWVLARRSGRYGCRRPVWM
jgi:hypothetical protein